MAAAYDLNVDQGATFTLSVTIKDSSNVAYDLTGYTAVAQIRERPESESVVATITCGFNSPRTDGVVNLSIAAATTATLQVTPSQEPDRHSQKYCYDLLITSGAGVKTRIIQGAVNVSPSVTR